MKVEMKQALNGVGVIGAILFVGAPIWAGYLWQSSTSEYIEAVRLFGANSILSEGKLYPYGAYAALSCASLVGLVMLVVGRDYLMVTPDQQPVQASKSAEQMEWR